MAVVVAVVPAVVLAVVLPGTGAVVPAAGAVAPSLTRFLLRWFYHSLLHW